MSLHSSVITILESQSITQQVATLNMLKRAAQPGTEQAQSIDDRLTELNNNLSERLYLEAAELFAEDATPENFKSMMALAQTLLNNAAAENDD